METERIVDAMILAAFAVVLPCWCFIAIRWLIEHWREFRELRRSNDELEHAERERHRRKMKRRTIGFLISDQAMELAQKIATTLNVNPLTQADIYSQLCTTCRESLSEYEQKALHIHRRIHPGDEEFQLFLTDEG
jgi:hypothetical protein